MTQDNWKEESPRHDAAASEGQLADTQHRVLDNLVNSVVAEQRRSRRWGIFFKLLTFAYLFFLGYLFLASDRLQISGSADSLSHTALIDVQGVIADNEPASADNIVSALREAFEDNGTKGVILRINSPGGSPVQSGYIYDEINRLRSLHKEIPVYAVISDIGASGAYYIAAAADQIYADKASLVGSIGVVSAGFGFVDLLEKLGVDRRIYTSGEHKGFLDPFQPQNQDEVAFWQSVLDTTHRQFIDSVKKGRGDRLKQDPALFSGLVWSGEQALDMGLIDGLGSSSFVARELIGEEEILDFTREESPLERFAKRIGAGAVEALALRLGTEGSPLR
ncbi:signal peptide peptidase SppA [Aestuariirhabdus litorea]|uniref:Signal peptide peptidase SppA n=1 Tax=Aestuariirhabdus litorea TaxID=2528527 RepID=A0A3P3VQV5_9GAMM|nr:signal peptide peptidase SppA [Aestuariirhabdus litorea]RRJ84697.1 signal peptide peptidase SppA [Aestuariirhabdus litorea]RWW97922.1 signal peptide peptidase SppA [Endozoicomonadaceae bacterium GTF-13]